MGVLVAGHFTNNAASGVLRKDHPNTLHHPVLALGGFSYRGLAQVSRHAPTSAGKG